MRLIFAMLLVLIVGAALDGGLKITVNNKEYIFKLEKIVD